MPYALGHYELEEHIGTGGMGAVYRATDVRLRRQVAVKVLHTPDLRPNEFRQRLLREAQSAAAIEHPNVATVLDVGEVDGLPFLVMPLLRGESMRSRLDRVGALPTADVLRIGQEVAEGLQAAHDAGLVHRDLKPENIWLEDTTDRVKILDFGLARSVEEDSALTQEGVVVGTPLYMAPEQALGGKVDARTDLFGLGGVLYRAATGKPAFIGKNALHTTVTVVTADPVAANVTKPEVPSALSDVIDRLLRKDPDQRFQSAGELADAFSKLVIQPQRQRVSGFTPARLLLAVAACVVMFGITIIVKNKDGSETRIEVPDTAESVVIDDNGMRKNIKLSGGKDLKSDHDIAAWIIDNGGSVSVRSGGLGNPRAVKDKSKLPANTELVVAQLSGDSGFTSESLKQLQNLEHLETLVLTKVELDGRGLKWLADLPKLRELRLQYMQLSEPAAGSLSSLPNLQTLFLFRSGIEVAGMKHLGAIETLESLVLNGNYLDAHLGALGIVPELTSLSIEATAITDVGIQAAIEKLDLESLSLRSCLLLTDESMRAVGTCKTLKQLNLKGPRISDKGVEYLEQLPSLENLSLQLTQTTAACVTSLHKHKSLSTLGLRGPTIDDQFVAEAAMLPALKQLNAHSGLLTDESLTNIRETSLTGLVIESQGITQQAVKQFAQANPACKITANR
ncbi:MAG: protein kinase [Planctomycetota bacterium]